MRYLFTVACFLISLYSYPQYTWWDIVYCLNGGENKSVIIPPSPSPNPVGKEGWNLIFQDEFDNGMADTLKWNRSNPWDDGDGSCLRHFAMNPDNIEPASGYINILNTAVSILPECSISSGEIKSMSVRDSSFKSYYFYARGYLEARVKLFNKPGQGAAMWLWGIGTPESPGLPGPWNEIDVFELNGSNSDIENGTYHWTSGENHVQQTQRIHLADTTGNYDLTSGWTIFGVEWGADSIVWSVNNSVVKSLDLKRIPPYCLGTDHYEKPFAPFCLRFSTGRNTVGDQSTIPATEDLPQAMKIDYVRVYQKNDQLAAPIRVPDGISQICISDTTSGGTGKLITTRYYPGTIYEWQSPAFTFTNEPEPIPQPPEKMRIRIKQGTNANQSYPVFLKTSFPTGYEERDTMWIFIPSDPPGMPSDSFYALRFDSSCYYSLAKRVLPGIAYYEYTLDGGMHWDRAVLSVKDGVEYAHFGSFKPFEVVQFGFRSFNACGYSPERVSSYNIPAPQPGCIWPSGINDENGDTPNGSKSLVRISPNPASDLIQIELDDQLFEKIRDYRMYLFDMTGNRCLMIRIDKKTTPADISHLSPGLYFVEVLSADNFIYRGKIIRQ